MKRISTLAFALVLSAGAGSLALAGQPGPDWMPIEQVKKALMAEGYTEISKLEADEGHWDGEGIKNGRRMKFDADPKTGAILGEIPD